MANLNLSQFTEKTLVADADWVFVWDTAGAISKKVSRNSLLSGTTADFHLGLADAAAPVAQTLSVQSVVAGTTNTAGQAFTIDGSQGTGVGAGGSIIFRTAPSGGGGSEVNALGTHMILGSDGVTTLRANGVPQLRMISTFGSGSVFNGLTIETDISTLAGFLANRSSGEIKIGALSTAGFYPTFYSNGVERMRIGTTGNVGIGTTAPSSKLHVAGNSSPAIAIDNTLATGYSQLLLKNTVVTGDTDGIFFNGSAQTGLGGTGSLNIKATTGPIAFHTATATNAFSIAQTGATTFSQAATFNTDIYGQRDVYCGNNRYFRFANSTALSSNAVGVMLLSDLTAVNLDPRMAFGGTTASFPALKRSSTTLQVRLADDNAFAPIQGKLTTDTAFTSGAITDTGYIVLYDSTGTAYKVACTPV
jgi:hypothetical protein